MVNMLWQPAHTQAAASQSAGERNLVEGNQAYAETFTHGHLALPPSQKYAICMLRNTTTAPRDRSD
jgi:carbonic anhydrase